MSNQDPRTLRITEIFFSLQGETRTVGIPTIFIRLTGCPLRCQYCDTAYAFYHGARTSFDEIFEKISRYPTRYITVTGGEPLAQKQCLTLLSELIAKGYLVSLETSGAIDVATVDPSVVKVIDVKTPGSKEESRNLFSNFQYLTPQDQIKFVICSADDYLWSKSILAEYKLNEKCEILFSPSYEQVTNKDLAEWILKDGLPVRMQIQLHKYIWGDVPGV